MSVEATGFFLGAEIEGSQKCDTAVNNATIPPTNAAVNRLRKIISHYSTNADRKSTAYYGLLVSTETDRYIAFHRHRLADR